MNDLIERLRLSAREHGCNGCADAADRIAALEEAITWATNHLAYASPETAHNHITAIFARLSAAKETPRE